MFGFGKKKEEPKVEPKVEVKEVEKIVLGDLEKVELYHPYKWKDTGGLSYGCYPTYHCYTTPDVAFDVAGSSGYVKRIEAYKVGDVYLAADGWKELEVKE